MGGKPPRPPAGDRGRPHFMLRTREPVRYWSGIRIPLPAGRFQPPLPGVLIAVSDSVTGRGFFFDPLPWMIVAAAVVVISTLFWIPMVRNITRPLTRMTHATEAITTGRFDVAIHEPRSDEIGRLARAINHMTSRLSALVKGQKRFLGDVAHELGSPIARIQFGLGALEQRIGAENRQRVVDLMDDVADMSGRLRVGDELSFTPNYSALLMAMTSGYVKKRPFNGGAARGVRVVAVSGCASARCTGRPHSLIACLE